ncbi:hypothetical protein [Virgibacillus necropolis]|uniref:Cytochrome c oxidase subunit 4 n=1 Tax=Virgibacillus necropolis TaxID=163877 RepID=A0A221MF68_9BACI|nr:hypothetical protein [Virgibacillus necropolis]ASN06303.1 hypothetical protein CFK40_15385 [Virgibacillus necropolis]
MIGWLNLGSLVLGLIGWILPVINLMRYENRTHSNWVGLSIMSISACAISLFFQIFNGYHRVKIEDWSALMDTMSAKVLIAVVLLIVTIILNVITLFLYRNRTVSGALPE